MSLFQATRQLVFVGTAAEFDRVCGNANDRVFNRDAVILIVPDGASIEERERFAARAAEIVKEL